MKIKEPYDRYLMMLGLATVLSATNPDGSFWTVFVITLAFTFAYWEGNYHIVGRVRTKFPALKDTKKRILTQVGWSFLYTIGVASFLVILLHFLGFVPYSAKYHLYNLALGLGITIIISIIYETVCYFQLWKEALLESERLKKVEARLQYESLKNQVNPHFLFNSLNTLSSLISVNPEKAEIFVQEFSKIYRYVLDVREKSFVPLSQELEFVDSYIYLQKIRFDDHLYFEKNIQVEMDDYFIPPLILQNLVENCIKHNKVNEKYPLKIQLIVQNGILKVINNLQERKEDYPSTKTGLYNIDQRFKLLNGEAPKFYTKNGQFIAEIKLQTLAE
ncbi:sensor histidine kinase [Marivirga sp.]|uniref:sensor histidine kinase n=1 Tax=Marivirga sp. TaxID=2018662 RepID=UPI003DA78110